MSGHSLTSLTHHRMCWVIECYGVQANFTCHAPAGSWCRLACAQCGPETCYSYEHDLTDGGLCGAVGWLSEVDAFDTFCGLGASPARDGSIVVNWDGRTERYTWRYPTPRELGRADGRPDHDRPALIAEALMGPGSLFEVLSTCPGCGHDTESPGCGCGRHDCACGGGAR